MPSVVTDNQRKQLLNRPEDDADKTALYSRRLNDFYVRKELKRWLGSIRDVNLALNTLSDRQTSDLFKNGEVFSYEDVLGLLEIVERALVCLDFVPLQRRGSAIYAEKSLIADPKEGNGHPHVFSKGWVATEQDIEKFAALMKHIERLQKFERPGPWDISGPLDKIYFKDLIDMADKEGYEPAEPGIETPIRALIPDINGKKESSRLDYKLFAEKKEEPK